MGIEGTGGRRRLRSVEQATALLRFVADQQDRPTTAADIAAGIGVGEDMCRRIAATLVSAELLRFDPDTSAYRLGPALAELALTVDRGAQIRRLAEDHLRALALDVGYPCVLIEAKGEDEYAVVVQAGDRRRRNQSAPVTEDVLAPSTALLTSARYAWAPRDVMDAAIARLAVSGRPMASMINPAGLRRGLSTVRRNGYASQKGEGGQAGVAAPVFERDGEVRYLVVVDLPPVGPDGDVARIGSRARAAARVLMEALGGSEPTEAVARGRSAREEEQVGS